MDQVLAICPLNPSVANSPITYSTRCLRRRLRSSEELNCSPVAVTYSQYLVLGCNVKSSDVVNVISWFHGCDCRGSGESVKHGLTGVPALSASYGDLWDGNVASPQLDRYICTPLGGSRAGYSPS